MLKALSVNIIGLSQKAHQFDYQFGDEFFTQYGSDLVSGGHFAAYVTLDKHETFIEATFKINGKAGLICDRSLDPFDFPIDMDKKIVFKYGEEETELSDEIIVISKERASLDIGQYIYEFIALSIPIKRLHPRYADEFDDEGEGKLIYSSTDDKIQKEDENIDPRWEKLKKLK
jgi:uncharacterized protein